MSDLHGTTLVSVNQIKQIQSCSFTNLSRLKATPILAGTLTIFKAQNIYQYKVETKRIKK